MTETKMDKDGYIALDENHNEAVMVTPGTRNRIVLHLSLKGACATVYLTPEQAREIASRLAATADGAAKS